MSETSREVTFKKSSLLIFHLSYKKCIILLLFVYKGVVMGDIVNIKLQAWWLLVIPFFLIFSLFVIALIMKGKTSEEEKNIEKQREKKKTLTSWIEKKDILYWLLIMCLAAISIFTFQYSGDKDVISHWGFAGTIVSIILAVVAIGFTLYQSLSSEFSSSKIIESAEIISKVSQELNSSDMAKSGEIINKAARDMNKYHSELEEKIISRVVNEIGDLRSHQEGIIKIVNDLYSEKMTKSNTNSFIVIEIDNFIDNLLNTFAKDTMIFSYIVIFFTYKKIKLTDRKINVYSFMENIGFMLEPHLKKDESPTGNGIMIGHGLAKFLSTQEWFEKFGILKSFSELDDDNKKEAVLKIEKQISEEFVRFIKSYVKE